MVQDMVVAVQDLQSVEFVLKPVAAFKVSRSPSDCYILRSN